MLNYRELDLHQFEVTDLAHSELTEIELKMVRVGDRKRDVVSST